ncbi:hypothetical protein AB5I41_26855 [Sphingomonas sp. MMS24-JH45]
MDLARADIATAPPQVLAGPPAPRRGVAGPPNTGPSGFADTPRVAGSGPHGEPLYAAAWISARALSRGTARLSVHREGSRLGPYRLPHGARLAGGGLRRGRRISARVEHRPVGARRRLAVQGAAAASGGKLRIGEWVRIRIDYDLR